ncbi:hypothetical protein AO262_31235 [Pseudomonas fluorescens ABAC62]|nr:hypothetical protein AO262_31235 [Pseudomonas fluorescens ABAC62]
MNRSLLFKLGAIALLILLLLIPLLMINGIISDRQQLRDGVVMDIARSSSYAQRVTGPVMVVPYRKTVREWKLNEKLNKRYEETREVRGRLYFLPERFELDGKVQTELRARGIYQARLFHADSRISGRFVLPEQWGISENYADYRFEPAFLAVGISDIRGIENALKLELGSQRLEFSPGSQVGWLGEGVHVELPTQDNKKNPSFIGNFLPTQREITDQGFTANWQTSFFATNLEEALRGCLSENSCEDFNSRSFGVNFIDPVDQYLKSDRAIKYALLFIALTFAGFFLFEVLKNLAVHPVQYALVGVALAFFYLLLLSLSEHLGFALAYLISASACVLLIGFYVCHVLRSVAHGLGFSAGLAALYGLLYGLLSAEDYALLMGSLLLFGLLGTVMVLTRKLDWYGVGKRKVVAPLQFDLEEVQ